jgi:hypothetical protein
VDAISLIDAKCASTRCSISRVQLNKVKEGFASCDTRRSGANDRCRSQGVSDGRHLAKIAHKGTII